MPLPRGTHVAVHRHRGTRMHASSLLRVRAQSQLLTYPQRYFPASATITTAAAPQASPMHYKHTAVSMFLDTPRVVSPYLEVLESIASRRNPCCGRPGWRVPHSLTSRRYEAHAHPARRSSSSESRYSTFRSEFDIGHVKSGPAANVKSGPAANETTQHPPNSSDVANPTVACADKKTDRTGREEAAGWGQLGEAVWSLGPPPGYVGRLTWPPKPKTIHKTEDKAAPRIRINPEQVSALSTFRRCFFPSQMSSEGFVRCW